MLPTLQVRPPLVAPASYPATSPAHMPQIRVAVKDAPAKALSLEITEPFRITPVGSPRVLHESPARLPRTSVTLTARGFQIGSVEIPASRIEIVPQRSPAVWVEDHQFRGTLRLYRQTSGTILAVNALPLEDYVASVIDSEMPAEFSAEARAAQAIVARTYALYQMQQLGRDALFDVYASTRSQKYLGYQYRSSSGRLLAGESAESRRLATETQGMVCLYGGKLFCTYYSAVCGGNTLNGTELFPDAVACVRSVPCDYCRAARLYRWNADISRGDMQAELKPLVASQGGRLDALTSLKSSGVPVAGRLPQFEIRNERRSYVVSGADLRRVLSDRSVYSPNFSIEDRGESFALSGKGHGHGVGLCQWGARGQAHEARTRFQIINHYYPGAKVVVLDYR